MDFIGSLFAREFDARTILPDLGPIDEIVYELELELAAEASESEPSSEGDATDQPGPDEPQPIIPLRVLLPRTSSTRILQPRQLSQQLHRR